MKQGFRSGWRGLAFLRQLGLPVVLLLALLGAGLDRGPVTARATTALGQDQAILLAAVPEGPQRFADLADGDVLRLWAMAARMAAGDGRDFGPGDLVRAQPLGGPQARAPPVGAA